MVANISINPALTSNAAGSFGIDWDGFIQGFEEPDPATRYALSSGLLATAETLPMWGGVLISEKVPTPLGSPPTTPQPSLGGYVARATNLAGGATPLAGTGFSVFTGGYGMINSPQSPVPLAYSGGQVMLYRFGSNARIAVAMAPALVALGGAIITTPVSWDYTEQQLIPYSPAYAVDVITAATWASTSGGQIDFTVSSDITASVNAGDIIEVTGITQTGAVGKGLNGQFTVVSISATHIIVTAAAAASVGTYVSGGTVVAGGGALPCTILRVKADNSMTVSYNSTTGFANWNRNAACALIQI